MDEMPLPDSVPDFVWQDHGGRPEQLKQGVS